MSILDIVLMMSKNEKGSRIHKIQEKALVGYYQNLQLYVKSEKD